MESKTTRMIVENHKGNVSMVIEVHHTCENDRQLIGAIRNFMYERSKTPNGKCEIEEKDGAFTWLDLGNQCDTWTCIPEILDIEVIYPEQTDAYSYILVNQDECLMV